MPKTKLEPTPDRVLLTYTGADVHFIAGVPACDLTEADVDFLTVRRGTTTAELVSELVAGPYRKAKGNATSADPIPTPEPAPAEETPVT